MSHVIRLGISTCPNDTFAFHAILRNKIQTRGIQFDIQLLDIQQLNDRLAAGKLDVAKVSFFAGLHLADATIVLPCGAAIGYGVGPLLLSNRATDLNEIVRTSNGQTVDVLCPGEHTTATFLTQVTLPFRVRPRQAIFSEIIPQLQSGGATFGACIHEARFVWRALGLHLIADLGELWERQTQKPLPLGGLCARRDLPQDLLWVISDVIRESIEYGLNHRDETLATMRKYAQELEDRVLFAHVDLYVNQWTVDMGPSGRQGLAAMHDLAIAKSLVPAETPPFRVLR